MIVVADINIWQTTKKLQIKKHLIFKIITNFDINR